KSSVVGKYRDRDLRSLKTTNPIKIMGFVISLKNRASALFLFLALYAIFYSANPPFPVIFCAESAAVTRSRCFSRKRLAKTITGATLMFLSA
ncbi:hypothetical protein, partial [Serratia fonticola]|uniref:hypothetical protein n=1 Tax=Serratia fonticola TaxID=47917 RepID=UPI0021BDBFED